MFGNILSAQSINHLGLRNGTLQLGNLSQNCVLVGQDVVHLLCNLLLSNKQQKHNNTHTSDSVIVTHSLTLTLH